MPRLVPQQADQRNLIAAVAMPWYEVQMARKRWIMAAGIVAATPAVAALLRQRIAGLRQRRRVIELTDEVEEAGLESFPASDPPSWTLGEE